MLASAMFSRQKRLKILLHRLAEMLYGSATIPDMLMLRSFQKAESSSAKRTCRTPLKPVDYILVIF